MANVSGYKKTIMNKWNIVVLFIALVLFSCCSTGNYSKHKSNNLRAIQSLDQCLIYAIENFDNAYLDSVVDIISDSVKWVYKGQMFFISDTVDIENQKIDMYSFILGNCEPLPPLKRRNEFRIEIKNYDTIIVQGKNIEGVNFKNKLSGFILNKDECDTLPEKRIRYIESIGDYKIPVGAITFYFDLVKLEFRTNEIYTLIKYLTNSYVTVETLRNNLAFDKFGKSFNNLQIREKKAIVTAIPCKIFINISDYEEIVMKPPKINISDLDIE